MTDKKKFKVSEVSEIIKAYVTETFIVEAKTKEDAKILAASREVDPIDYDVDVRSTEYMYADVEEINEEDKLHDNLDTIADIEEEMRKGTKYEEE